jgi:transcriptional regulator with XRE-family HTH domain
MPDRSVAPVDLQSLREQAKLTRNELAAKAGVSATTVWRIEQGQHPAQRTWRQLLRVLNEFQFVHAEMIETDLAQLRRENQELRMKVSLLEAALEDQRDAADRALRRSRGNQT